MKRIIYVSGKEYKSKVKECISLDKIVYESKYVGSEHFYQKSFEVRAQNFVFAIDTKTGNLAGYMLCTPVEESIYNDMKTGNFIDTKFIKSSDIKDISKNNDNYMYIYSLVVSPEFQGLGIARSLMSKFFDDVDSLCEDYNISAILADTINPKMFNYLSKNGFYPIGVTDHESVLVEKVIAKDDIKEMVI